MTKADLLKLAKAAFNAGLDSHGTRACDELKELFDDIYAPEGSPCNS